MEHNADKLILHCDLNNFYASVECLTHPEWRDIPMAVTGDADKRHGIILAKNEHAKRYGVQTAEAIWQAKRKCPDLLCVEPHHALYSQYSKRVFDLYTRFTPLVEPFGPDECWLDATGCTSLFGDGQKLADAIRETVKAETGLTVSVGVSFNKIFAKLGSDMKKPDGTTVITRSNYKNLVWRLPASDLFGVGRKTAEKLRDMNIRTIGELALSNKTVLTKKFGIIGAKMHEYANGQCYEGVREAVVKHKTESVGHGMTTVRDITSYEDCEAVIYYLSDRVAARMRKSERRGTGISLDLRFSDLSHLSRQKKLNYSTCSAADISHEVIALMRAMWDRKKPLRTVTVSVYALCGQQDGTQLDLFSDSSSRDKTERLEKAIDKLNGKYGSGAVIRGNLTGSDFIYDKTDDEDFLPFKR